MHKKPEGVDLIRVIQETGSDEIHALDVPAFPKVNTGRQKNISELVIADTTLFEKLNLWKSSGQVVIDLSFVRLCEPLALQDF